MHEFIKKIKDITSHVSLKKILLILVPLLSLGIIEITLWLGQQQQDVRQRAGREDILEKNAVRIGGSFNTLTN